MKVMQMKNAFIDKFSDALIVEVADNQDPEPGTGHVNTEGLVAVTDKVHWAFLLDVELLITRHPSGYS